MDENDVQEMDEGEFREVAEALRVFPGRGDSLEAAIENAWRNVPQDRKPGGLVVEQIRVAGGNPINWYGVILRG